MRPRRTEGRGGLNEVFNQPVTLEIWMEKAEKVLILTDPLNEHLRHFFYCMFDILKIAF